MSEGKETRALVPVRRGHAPSKCTPEVADEIITRMCHGETLIQICKKERNGRLRVKGEFPSYHTVQDWADPTYPYCIPHFTARFASARLRQQYYWAEECIDIANEPEAGYEEIVEHSEKNGVTIRRARKDMLHHRALKIDTRLKILSKINPTMWAERLQQLAPADNSAQPKLVVEGGLPDDAPPPAAPKQEP